MLSRAFEWYRIVHAKPTSQTIDNRSAAVRDVLKAIDDAEDWDLALGLAEGVVVGFDLGFAQDSPVVQSLVGAIRAHESAFPEDLSENALELRACAAVALGEIMVRKADQAPVTDALLTASVLRSGLGARPAPKGKYLKQLLDELEETATKTLASGGLSCRRRPVKLAQRLEKLQEPPDLSTTWNSLVPALRKAINDIDKQSAIDREELNILWWMFAGTSITTGQPLSAMPIGAAALCCGAELSAQCMVPPITSLESMVRRAYEAGRKPQELADRSIKEIAADWSGHVSDLLAPDEETKDFAQAYPALLPLSWLCARLLASRGGAEWTEEFKRITGIPFDYALPPAKWAIQAFLERVSYRLYTGS